MVDGALGRRWPAVGRRRPDSAAWAARKRKSIDCAFSELRAMVGECDEKGLCSELAGAGEVEVDLLGGDLAMGKWVG